MIENNLEVQKTIGKYCREFRYNVGASLKDVAGEHLVKNVSGFEHGRSSHMKYLLYYSQLADRTGLLPLFILGLGEVMEELILEIEKDQ